MIDQLISETTDLDFKEAVERSKPRSWLKSVSAFANGIGGAVVFGVEDSTHKVVGLTDPQADADFVSEAIKTRIEPLPPFELHAGEEFGLPILAVRVHASGNPPHYLALDGRRDAYVRVGNQSVVAPSEVLSELILKGTHRTWDTLDSGIPADRASSTVLKATYAQRMHGDLDGADLASFGLVTASGMLTNAGAALADQALLRHSRVFCTRYTGPTRTISPTRRSTKVACSHCCASLRHSLSATRRNRGRRPPTAGSNGVVTALALSRKRS